MPVEYKPFAESQSRQANVNIGLLALATRECQDIVDVFRSIKEQIIQHRRLKQLPVTVKLQMSGADDDLSVQTATWGL